MINDIAEHLKQRGYSKYNLHESENFQYSTEDMTQLKAQFPDMPLDTYSAGNRLRNYIQVSCQQDKIRFGRFEPYQQTKRYNPITGGVVRDYQSISDVVLNSQLFNMIVAHDIEVVRQLDDMPQVEDLMIGVHLFRYSAGHQPAFSSPSWLHKDDEDVVFLHLVDVSTDLIGGESIIASLPKNIDRVLRLQMPFDTLVVNHNCYHAVTPMSIPDHYPQDALRHRDIILVTFQKRPKAA
ncbi:MAG: 2OG-Fe dioxygenase family protein [Chania sp.]